jgi:hypothetical protein
MAYPFCLVRLFWIRAPPTRAVLVKPAIADRAAGWLYTWWNDGELIKLVYLRALDNEPANLVTFAHAWGYADQFWHILTANDHAELLNVPVGPVLE